MNNFKISLIPLTVILTVSLVSGGSSSLVFAQYQVDSAQVRQLITEGQELVKNSKYEIGRSKYIEGRILAESILQWKEFYWCEELILESLWEENELEKLLTRAERILPELRSKLGFESIREGFFYYHMGTAELVSGMYDSSIVHYNKAIKICQKYEKGLEVVEISYNNMGAVYTHLGDLNKVQECFQKSLELGNDIDGLSKAVTLNNIGVTLIQRSLYSSAIDYYQESLQILEENGEKGNEYNNVLVNMGSALIHRGEYKKAYEYQLRALRNSFQMFGDTHLDNAYYYIGIADNFENQGLYDSSRYYFQKALEFEDQLKKVNLDQLIFLHSGLALVELGIDNSEAALFHIRKAIELAKKTSNDNYNLIYLNQNLGHMYFEMGKIEKARKQFEKSINMYKSLHGTDRSGLAISYLDLSRVYKQRKEYAQSLEYIQMSVNVNYNQEKIEDVINNTIDLKEVINKWNYLISLEEKLDVLNLVYSNKKDINNLKIVLDTYSNIDVVIRFVRKSISTQEDKHKFQEIRDHIYADAVNAYYTAYEVTKSEAYLEKCYYFSEASKSGLLSDALNTLAANDWSGLPRGLLKLELENKADLVYYRSVLNEELLKENKEKNSARIELFESKLFEINRSLDSVMIVLERDYLTYFQIKYDAQIASVREIQEHLTDNKKLIEYFLDDSISYAFLISKDDYVVKQLTGKTEIVLLAERFRDEIDKIQNVNTMISTDTLFEVSHQLYNVLLRSFCNELNQGGTDKLIIIPDAQLGYIPFEMLLTKAMDIGSTNSNDYSYLIKDYVISYAYSATLLFGGNIRTSGNESYLSFAPVYDSEDSLYLGKFRDAFVSLNWNQGEASSIGQYLSGDALLGEMATEKSFKENAAKAGILHFAMHAFIDDDEPMNSKLVFYQDNDSIEDGFLHTFELYNMKLEASLAVLSACETGYGKLVKGEGIMSLARGFAYAGVPSVIMSHWKVDDQSTSLIMQYFYKYLAEGLSKSEALRKAKLDYLAEASPNKQHPFFWGAFVVIGDDAPMFNDKDDQWIYYGLGVFFIMIFIGVMRRRLAAT